MENNVIESRSIQIEGVGFHPLACAIKWMSVWIFSWNFLALIALLGIFVGMFFDSEIGWILYPVFIAFAMMLAQFFLTNLIKCSVCQRKIFRDEYDENQSLSFARIAIDILRRNKFTCPRCKTVFRVDCKKYRAMKRQEKQTSRLG